MTPYRHIGFAFLAGLLLAVSCSLLWAADSRQWKTLEKDDIHDPQNPALKVMQQPAAALRILPPDTAGNQVSWVKALRDGYIKPRTNLYETTEVRILDSNILMKRTAEMPYVLFPHRPHTEWLDCSNCHEKLFKSQAGATPVNMFAILQGEYCGRCHGAVSFPLTECARCHSVPQKSAGASQPEKK